MGNFIPFIFSTIQSGLKSHTVLDNAVRSSLLLRHFTLFWCCKMISSKLDSLRRRSIRCHCFSISLNMMFMLHFISEADRVGLSWGSLFLVTFGHCTMAWHCGVLIGGRGGGRHASNMFKSARKLVKKSTVLQRSWPQRFPWPFILLTVPQMVKTPPNGMCLGTSLSWLC